MSTKLPDADRWMLIGHYYEKASLLGAISVKLVDEPAIDLTAKDKSTYPPADKRVHVVMVDHVGGYLAAFVPEINTIVACKAK